MKKYYFRLLARQLGAIGKYYEVTMNIKAASLKEALVKMYDKWEVHRFLETKESGKSIDRHVVMSTPLK